MEDKRVPEAGLSKEASTRQMMIEVMTELGKKRVEYGVLSIGPDPNNPDRRFDIFIAPVEAKEHTSSDDIVGGDYDIVVATTQGFFALRHYTSPESGDFYFKKMVDDLEKMWTNSKGVAESEDSDDFRISKDTDGYALEFEGPRYSGGTRKYRESGNPRGKDQPLLFKLVPVGEDTVNRAFEASKEKARELLMGDPKTGIRLQDSQQAARSLLDKMKET